MLPMLRRDDCLFRMQAGWGPEDDQIDSRVCQHLKVRAVPGGRVLGGHLLTGVFLRLGDSKQSRIRHTGERLRMHVADHAGADDSHSKLKSHKSSPML